MNDKDKRTERIAVLCPKGDKIKYKIESAKRDMTLSTFFAYCVNKELEESKKNGL